MRGTRPLCWIVWSKSWELQKRGDVRGIQGNGGNDGNAIGKLCAKFYKILTITSFGPTPQSRCPTRLSTVKPIPAITNNIHIHGTKCPLLDPWSRYWDERPSYGRTDKRTGVRINYSPMEILLIEIKDYKILMQAYTVGRLWISIAQFLWLLNFSF
jgi:hypothetical protein